MDDELIEEIDWCGNIVGVHPKNLLKKKMFPHKVSLIIPRTKDNKFILSKRAKDQEPWPDTWVCAVGGKVAAEESFEKAALREMKEEIGVVCELEEVGKFSYDDKNYKAIFQIYTTKKELDIDLLRLNPEEIQFSKAFSLDEIQKSVEQNPENFAKSFIPTMKEFVKNVKR